MPIPDVRGLLPADRARAAELVRVAKDFNLPDLEYVNSSPCVKHEDLEPTCLDCGIAFFQHQRVGVAWLYLKGKGLLADEMGAGKTIMAAGLLAILKQTGEMDGSRTVIVVRPPALLQWQAQLSRILPKLHTSTATGTRRERIEKYLSPWDVMIISYHMMQRDYEALLNFNVQNIIIDDIDALRHPETKTAYAIKRVANQAGRVVICTGTPLQKRLEELHSVLEPIGGREIFGPIESFDRRYIRRELTTTFDRTGKKKTEKKVVGYKNLDEFKRLVAPLALRRTSEELDDVKMPALIHNTIYLEPYPKQKEKYAELKKGVLKIIREEGTRVKRAKAMAQFVYGAQICSGLCTLGEPDLPKTSAKLDWLEEKLVGDLSEEKVVVFANFRNAVQALQVRLRNRGIGFETIWGGERDKTKSYTSQDRFWRDPTCKVLIGTTTLEQSLNLQIARHLVNIDTILNPARMAQLAGRIKRIGSAFHTVYVHSLLLEGTQESKYEGLLQREQALINHIWDEESDLFEGLSSTALLDLIGGS